MQGLRVRCTLLLTDKRHVVHVRSLWMQVNYVCCDPTPSSSGWDEECAASSMMLLFGGMVIGSSCVPGPCCGPGADLRNTNLWPGPQRPKVHRERAELCRRSGEPCDGGNGRRDSGEGCDDANRVAGDGCGQFCQAGMGVLAVPRLSSPASKQFLPKVEPGYACVPMAVQGPGLKVI